MRLYLETLFGTLSRTPGLSDHHLETWHEYLWNSLRGFPETLARNRGNTLRGPQEICYCNPRKLVAETPQTRYSNLRKLAAVTSGNCLEHAAETTRNTLQGPLNRCSGFRKTSSGCHIGIKEEKLQNLLEGNLNLDFPHCWTFTRTKRVGERWEICSCVLCNVCKLTWVKQNSLFFIYRYRWDIVESRLSRKLFFAKSQNIIRPYLLQSLYTKRIKNLK